MSRIELEYTRLADITDDIDDARVYRGIHFRFDQEAGALQGRKIGRYVVTHNLRSSHEPRSAFRCEHGEPFEVCLLRALRLHKVWGSENRYRGDRLVRPRRCLQGPREARRLRGDPQIGGAELAHGAHRFR